MKDSVAPLLAAYGTEPHEREVGRVRLAILKLSRAERKRALAALRKLGADLPEE